MADGPREPISTTPNQGIDEQPTEGRPRWVKVFAVIAALVVLAVVIAMVTGGGHGPSRHLPSGGADGQTTPSEIPEGHTPPPGVPDHGAPE